MLYHRSSCFLLRPQSLYLLNPTYSLRQLTTTIPRFNDTDKKSEAKLTKKQVEVLSDPQLAIPANPKTNPKIGKIISKLPKSLQKYGHRLINAPISHITSFLILHELTAVVPFLGLWYFFHHFQFLPADIPSWIIIKGTKFAESVLGDTINDWSIADRTRIIIEGATAYGIVKATFPLRVIFSLFMTPWFARVLVNPIFNLFRKILGIKKKVIEK
ncbi:hypothetical protein WICMUC_001454 [Wickerhamomyces mucosus]|uniref:Uncharacterized protein n=1 Tax=Wickerhamomyces mucosus TaxID=1378264 RepID=A0A9P8PU46_9ASCO|nr:hypothetical protein WICMUC_001454 [Wickerhamomyces mucosus]